MIKNKSCHNNFKTFSKFAKYLEERMSLMKNPDAAGVAVIADSESRADLTDS